MSSDNYKPRSISEGEMLSNPGDLDEDGQEILQKVSLFSTHHAIQLQEFNKYYKMYNVQPTKTRAENQSNTVIPELFVEVEALATAIQEMVFSDNSENLFFDVVAQDGGNETQQAEAAVTKATIAKQIELNDLQTKTLPFFRMLALHGNWPVEISWKLAYKSFWDFNTRVRRPAFDCWDFRSFPLVNFSFDDSQEDIEAMGWCAETEHVSAKNARMMVKQGIWDDKTAEEAIDMGVTRNVYDREQRLIRGYMELPTKGKATTIHHYYGTLESRDDNETYWAVIDSRGNFLKQPEINPFKHGEKPWLLAKWFSLPTEPYALGTGHINYRTQSEINDRRNFINDMLYASLYSMWLKRSDSGIATPGGKMRWSPHQIIEGDMIDDTALRRLLPDLGALGPAISLEANDMDKMRRQSGATSTLQAIATGITATETQQIQSEATRRLKAMVRSNISSVLRKMLYRAHELNLQFMDNPMKISAIGANGTRYWGNVSQQDLITEPDIRMKLTTDLDFRPFKRRELIDLLQTFGQLQANGMLGQRKIIPDPIIEEIAASYGMDPRKFFSKPGLQEMMVQQQMANPQVQQQAMQGIMTQSPGANRVMNSPKSALQQAAALPGAMA